jgi:hypothetical protein
MSRLLSAFLIIGSVLGADKAGADMRNGLVGSSSSAARSEPVTGSSALTASGASKPETGKSASERPKMLLKLGSLKTDPEFERLNDALASASRQALSDIPGVRILEESEDAAAAVAKRKPPVVLITGKLAEIGQREDGEEVLISAKVEYFVHRMPGESIAAVVSGVATARVAPIQMQKRRLRERLERSLVAAAVESAAKRTPPALKAAAD